MKALSIRQPWAWLIVRPDLTDREARAHAALEGLIKTLENRSRNSRHRGPLLIHSSAGLTRKEYIEALRFLDSRPDLRCIRNAVPDFEDLERGGIVGVAYMGAVIGGPNQPLPAEEYPWYIGGDAYGYILTDSRPLPFTPWKGALNLFEVPDDQVPGLASMRQGVPA